MIAWRAARATRGVPSRRDAEQPQELLRLGRVERGTPWRRAARAQPRRHLYNVGAEAEAAGRAVPKMGPSGKIARSGAVGETATLSSRRRSLKGRAARLEAAGVARSCAPFGDVASVGRPAGRRRTSCAPYLVI